MHTGLAYNLDLRYKSKDSNQINIKLTLIFKILSMLRKITYSITKYEITREERRF